MSGLSEKQRVLLKALVTSCWVSDSDVRQRPRAIVTMRSLERRGLARRGSIHDPAARRAGWHVTTAGHRAYLKAGACARQGNRNGRCSCGSPLRINKGRKVCRANGEGCS